MLRLMAHYAGDINTAGNSDCTSVGMAKVIKRSHRTGTGLHSSWCLLCKSDDQTLDSQNSRKGQTKGNMPLISTLGW